MSNFSFTVIIFYALNILCYQERIPIKTIRPGVSKAIYPLGKIAFRLRTGQVAASTKSRIGFLV